MKAVILAGGFGSRLSEETDKIPKPMVEIGGMPVLWHIMKIYSCHGVNDFVVCLGYKGYLIKEYFNNYLLHTADVTIDFSSRKTVLHNNRAEAWRITLVDTGLGTNTGGRLKHIAKYLNDETFCMTYGDGVGDVDITASIEFHRSHGKLATVTAIQPPGRFGALRVEDSEVTKFGEKVDADGSIINGGYFVLEPKVLDYIEADNVAWERAPLERLATEHQLMAFHHRGFWQPMDTLRDKRLLEELWETGEAPWCTWK
jgi:glucose-1-phosphate cytidylyltransferase